MDKEAHLESEPTAIPDADSPQTATTSAKERPSNWMIGFWVVVAEAPALIPLEYARTSTNHTATVFLLVLTGLVLFTNAILLAVIYRWLKYMAEPGT